MPRLGHLSRLTAAVASLACGANAIRDDAAVATLASEDWELYDSRTGPEFKDVAQGQLGDCYYLAGLAALAKNHPEIIREAFITKGEVNSRGRSIYKLRFLVDGEEKIVAVDDSIPMFEKPGYITQFYFARLSGKEEAWPALLEKGFAKLFGSYFAIRGGWGFQTFKSIVQSPVDVLHKKPLALMQSFIEEAHRNKWPVTGGTQKNNFGTAAGHAYVILSTGIKEGQKAVEVYNPWGTNNNYNGKLKHISSRNAGDYWMTLEEFGQAFNMVSRARILPNAHLSSVRIPVGVATAISFKTSITRRVTDTNPSFYVQLEWPDGKVLPDGCRIRKHESTLSLKVALIEPNGKAARASLGKRPMEWHEVSNMRATVPMVAGTYIALVGAFFDKFSSSAIDHVVMNVYAEEPVSFQQADVGLAAKALYGLCDDVLWRDGHIHLARAKDFRGSPAWEGFNPDPNKAKTPPLLWIANGNRGEIGPRLSSSRKNPGSLYKAFRGYVECLDPKVLHQFDNCDFVTWQGRYKFQKTGTYAGAPQFAYSTSSEKYNLMFQGGEWTVGEPGSYGSYYEKGTKNLKCGSSQSSYHIKGHRGGSSGGSSKNGNRGGSNYNNHGNRGNNGYYNNGKHYSYHIKGKSLANVTDDASGQSGQSFAEIHNVVQMAEVQVSAEANIEAGELKNVNEAGHRSGGLLEMKLKRSEFDHELHEVSVDQDLDEENETGPSSGVCDQNLVQRMVKRYSNLDNYNELKAGKQDRLFPEQLSSIGDPNKDCGDSATGKSTSCRDLNHWVSITQKFGKPSTTPRNL